MAGAHLAQFYRCTDEILAGLAEMYVADERFRNSIDAYAPGLAEFAAAAIQGLCQREGTARWHGKITGLKNRQGFRPVFCLIKIHPHVKIVLFIRILFILCIAGKTNFL